jgi:hypothetical protein
MGLDTLFMQTSKKLPFYKYCKRKSPETAADSYTMKRMACNKSRWKAANQTED